MQIEGSSESTLSDNDGNYHLSYLNAPNSFLKGTLSIQVYAPGYKPASKGINLSYDEIKKTLDFVLMPKARQLS